jgi:alpha-glucosidase
LALRREQPAIVTGRFESVPFQDPLLAYRRVSDDHQLFVALNLSGDPQSVTLNEEDRGRVLLSTYLDRDDESVREQLKLRGHEGIIVVR